MSATLPHTARLAQTAATTLGLEAQIRTRLEQRRLAVADEIRHYPSPIAGCDQQFNWLLDEYAHVRAQLQRLEAVCSEACTVEQLAERLESFDPEAQPREAYPHDTVHTH